jgi:hypothetical protein
MVRIVSMGGNQFPPDLAETVPFKSDMTLLDYDILLWNPVLLINEYFTNTNTNRFQDGGVVLDEMNFNKILMDISRRDTEMNDMLDNGKSLFVYTPYPMHIYTTATQTVNILEYFTLLRVKTSSASGKRIEFRGDEIFCSFWEQNKDILEYKAVFKEIAGKPLFYIQGLQVVVGSYIKVKNGHIIFLPTINPHASNPNDVQKVLSDYIESIIALDKDLRKNPEEFDLPEWSKSYILPHEYEQIGNLLQLEEELNTLRRRVDEQKRLINELERNKILFTGKGRVLELLVKKVFEDLGITVTEGAPGKSDLILQFDDKIAVVEVKGVDRKSAAESHARQLEQWVSEYYLESNEVKAKGILIVNAFKDTPLKDRREAPFPDQMLPYAQAREHCLMTGMQLLGLYLDCKEDDEKKRQMIDLMFATNGIFSEYQDWTNFIADESKIDAITT